MNLLQSCALKIGFLILCLHIRETVTISPSNNSHVQSLLQHLDVNATVILPDQLYCPSGALNNSFKQHSIYIGVLGCILDPLLHILSQEDREAAHNDSCRPNAPGYYPPVAEYILAMLMHIEELNNRTDILPYHKLCILSGIPLNLSTNINSAFNTFVNHALSPIVLDVAHSDNSIFLQHLVLPANIPMIRYSNYGKLHPVNSHMVWRQLSARINNRPPAESISQVHLAQEQFEDYFFVAGPDALEVHYAILDVAKYYQWKQIAYILADDWAVARLSPGFTLKYTGINIMLHFFGYKQGNSDILNLFRALTDREIRVIVFHGTVARYFNLLLAASRYLFVGPGYVWIFPYAGAVFPDNYDNENLWCGYTNSEVFAIKNALKGSLSIGVTEGKGSMYEAFSNKFTEYSERVTGDTNGIYQNNTRFSQTTRIYDIIGFLAQSFQTLVLEKAELLNTTESAVDISFKDRHQLKSILHQTVLHSEAIAGNLSFTSAGDRETTYIAIRNMVPFTVGNFSVNNSRELTPWVSQVRAYLINRPAESNVFEFYFLDGNGTSVGAQPSTIVFASGTTTPPPDRPIRLFVRTFTASFTGSVVSTFLFMFVVLVYIYVVYHQDKKREMYNTSWMFNENDLHYIAGERQQGIWGRLNNITKVMGIRSMGNLEEAAKLNDGNIAVLVRLSLPKNVITDKVYQECNTMRDLKHVNICPFYGCLLNGTRSALLYKYYPRGTLKYVLQNSNIDFQCVFRISFALDVSHGMEYLHSKKIYHGRLKTENCVIDENWVIKLRNYGLEDLHKHWSDGSRPQGRSKNYGANPGHPEKVAPEIRWLGTTHAPSVDIFSFGLLLEELIIDKKNNPEKTNDFFVKLPSMPKNNISPKLHDLMNDCLDTRPNHRPSFEAISARLIEIGHREHNITEHGVMQIYSRQLEERLEELSDRVAHQSDKQNEIMQHYIPKTMIEAIKQYKDVPIQEFNDVAILCIELTQSEKLLEQLNSESIEYLVLTMQKAIEGVCATFNMDKIHSNGNMWILACGIHSTKEGGITDHITEAANAAITVIETFSGIFLPGLTKKHPSVRLGLHTGTISCGVIEEPVPQVVSIGEAISTTINIASASKDGKILSSLEVGQQLKNCFEFKVIQNLSGITCNGKSLVTCWIELTKEETLSRAQTPQNLNLSLNRNITIKQCVRKHTISSPMDIKTIASARGGEFPTDRKQANSKYTRDRSISLTGNQKMLSVEIPLQRSRTPSLSPNRCKISPFILRRDSGLSSGYSEQEGDVAPRVQSARSSIASTTTIHVRPWSACSEPAQLINTEALDDLV